MFPNIMFSKHYVFKTICFHCARMCQNVPERPIWKKFTFWIITKRTFLLKLINMVKYSNQSKHIFSLNSGIKKQKIHFWLFRTKTPKTPISLFFSTLSAEKFNNRNLSKFHKNIFLLAGISIQGSLTNINPPPQKKKLHL